ncbi:MAG: A24 family peptidase C-terminal domain-containing protein [Thermoplasmata archaeon]
MDAQEAIVALQLVSTGVVLCYASLLDLRTRRVGNVFWMALSAAAIILLVARVLVDEAPLEYLLVLVPVLAVLADVYGQPDESEGFRKSMPVVLYAVAIVATVYLAYLWVDDRYFAHLLTAPVMMLVIVVMYMLDVVKGGADAKALMALSIMFPFYPAIGSLPIVASGGSPSQILFPFTFAILFAAAIIVALTPLWFMVRNLVAGEFSSPYGFFGYKLDAEVAKRSHVWLMERMEDGAHRRHVRPIGDERLSEEIDKLVSAGHGRIWVTPKVPFIIPMTIAFIFTTAVGNILFIIMGL